MTEVSNPMQRETKETGDEFKFVWPQKYCNTLWNAVHASRRRHGLNYLRKPCSSEKEGINFSLPKTNRSSKPSAHWPIIHYHCFSVGQRLFYWIQKYLEWITPQKLHFQSQQPTTKKKKKGNAFSVCYFSVVLQGVSLHLAFQNCFAIFSNTNMTWMRNASYSLALKRASMMKKWGALVFSPLRRAGENIYHHSPLHR